MTTQRLSSSIFDLFQGHRLRHFNQVLCTAIAHAHGHSHAGRHGSTKAGGKCQSSKHSGGFRQWMTSSGPQICGFHNLNGCQGLADVGSICSHCLEKIGLLSGHVCHAPGQKQLGFALTFNPFDLSCVWSAINLIGTEIIRHTYIHIYIYVCVCMYRHTHKH